jgi:hypothetical protein
MVPEEQDIHANHSGDEDEHVKRDGRMPSHCFTLRVGISSRGGLAEHDPDSRK